MNVLQVSTTSVTANKFLRPFAEYMREKGHHVSFACSAKDYPDAPSRVRQLEDAGFEVHEIAFARRIRPFQDVKAFWNLLRLVLSNKYDVVHTHTSKAGFIGRIAARLAGCPVVVHTAHDLFARAFGPGLKRSLFIFLEKLASPFCNSVLFVSEAVRQDAIRYRLKSEDSLIFVGNGIDADEYTNYQSDRVAIRHSYGINADDLWVGSVGRLVPNKGIDTFVRAAALVSEQFPKARFVVASDGPLRGELEELAHSLGIAEKVQFTGLLPSSQSVMDLMSGLDVFVLPTRREGLGIVFVEAMALGCPVVGSRIEPVDQVVRHGETGLLATVDDPNDFAEAILTLLRDPQLRREMSEAGPEYVKSKYDLQLVFERTENVYHQVRAQTSPLLSEV